MSVSGRDVLLGSVAGLIAGLGATWVKSRVQSAWTELAEVSKEPSNDRRQSEGQPEESATVKAAEAISKKVFHRELSDEQKGPPGSAVDYSFGSAAGALYGAVVEVAPKANAAVGLGFGSLVWLFGDELGVPAAGFAKWPTRYPASTHAYSLAGHLTYGFTCELIRRIVRQVLR